MSSPKASWEPSSCPECGGKLARLLFLGVQPEGLVCTPCKVLYPLPTTAEKKVTSPPLGKLYTGEGEH